MMNKLQKNYLISTYPNRGINFVEAKGVYLIDKQAKKYLDLGSNYGINIFGYQHPRIIKALQSQLYKLPNLHGSFMNDVRNRAAETLIEKCARGLSQVFFSNSGAEAIEASLKFARIATGKTHFIAMEHGYHGKTLGALSATGSEKYRRDFLPLLWNFTHAPFGNITALKASITPHTAALIIEPVQGESGIRFASKKYLIELNNLCRQQGVLLIVDEIQTGLGRTGTFLASEQFGLMPDILCLGKGLAGGIPIGATLVTKKIASKIKLHIHTSTFGGNPLACAGIVAVLEELEKNKILKHIREIGKYFLWQLKTIKHKKIVDVRGLGLMLGIELRENATPVLQALQREQIIAIPAGSNIVRFLPPYLIATKEVDRTIRVLRKIFS